MFEATLHRQDDEAAPRTLAAVGLVLLAVGACCLWWSTTSSAPHSAGLSLVPTELSWPEDPGSPAPIYAPAPPAGGAPAASVVAVNLQLAPPPEPEIALDDPPPLDQLSTDVVDRAPALSGPTPGTSGLGTGSGTGDGEGDGDGDGDGTCPPGQTCTGGGKRHSGKGPVVKRPYTPDYPQELKRLNLGTVRCAVEVDVNSFGRANDVRVGGCPEAFHPNARAAFLRYRWYPAKDAHGSRVPSTYRSTIRYSLR